MGLRNAFEEVATEGLIRRLMDQLRFAKDPADRMRVAVDTWPGSVVVYANGSNTVISSALIPPFASASWNSMDAREEFRDITLQSFQNTRNRWTIT